MRCHLTPVGITVTVNKMIRENKCWWGCGKKETHTADGNVKLYIAITEQSGSSSEKLKLELSWPSSPTPSSYLLTYFELQFCDPSSNSAFQIVVQCANLQKRHIRKQSLVFLLSEGIIKHLPQALSLSFPSCPLNITWKNLCITLSIFPRRGSFKVVPHVKRCIAPLLMFCL